MLVEVARPSGGGPEDRRYVAHDHRGAEGQQQPGEQVVTEEGPGIACGQQRLFNHVAEFPMNSHQSTTLVTIREGNRALTGRSIFYIDMNHDHNLYKPSHGGRNPLKV